MPLGLPSSLAGRSTRRALGTAALSFAMICLAAALLIVVMTQAAEPSVVLWPAMLALVPIAAVLVRVTIRRTVASALLYLIVGSWCLFIFTFAVSAALPYIDANDNYLLVLVKLALVMASGPSRTVWRSLPWPVAGYLVGEVSVSLAISATGGDAKLDPVTLASLAVVLLVRILLAAGRRTHTASRERLQEAARAEQASVLRTDIEAKASALVHDTVLAHLATVARAEPGALSPVLAETMAADLESLEHDNWLQRHARLPRVHGNGWAGSALSSAIDAVRDRGLDVAVAGDLDAVAHLGDERDVALALAVQQCLVNVLEHANTDHAEVVVAESSDELTVMVVDEGDGFEIDRTPGDRLGLRQSVRQRIESVGGSVRVWSTVGRGTTVMISVPNGGLVHDSSSRSEPADAR